MLNAVAKMFLSARVTNAARHAAKGTLLKHMVRKSWIKMVLRMFGPRF